MGQEKSYNLYGAVGQRTLLSMNDYIGMSSAYRFSPNRKMSRAEQLFLSLQKNKYQPIAINGNYVTKIDLVKSFDRLLDSQDINRSENLRYV